MREILFVYSSGILLEETIENARNVVLHAKLWAAAYEAI